MSLEAYTLKTLSISSAHLSPFTVKSLMLDKNMLFNAQPTDYGWIVPSVDPGKHLDSDDEKLTVAAHYELYSLLKFAHTQGFAYVWFDRDASELPIQFGFETFDW